MLAAAGRDRSSCPITIYLYPEELDAFAPDQVGALACYEALGVMDMLGMAGGVMREELTPMHGLFQNALLSSPGMRIAGGSDEILRNIIAERVLGLPGDIRVDKDLPFNRLPSGAR